MGLKIQRVNKTKEGNIKISFTSINQEKNEQLLKEIREATTLATTLSTKTTELLIRHISEETTKKDVENAIKNTSTKSRV